MKPIKSPILITGAARSGTSMTAGIISLSGAFGGDMNGPNRYNKKGMFENNTIRQDIVKPYLKSLGCDPLGQAPLPDNNQIFNVTEEQAEKWREKIRSVFDQQGYKGGDFFYKGAKMCLNWFIWHKAFPSAKWVIVRRDDNDIVRSCLQTGFMRAYRDAVGWHKWVDHHKQKFEQMKVAGLLIKEVWPTKMINGDFTEIESVINWLGLEYNDSLARSFIDPGLWGKK